MKTTISKAIGQALHEEMVRDENVIIVGEDMAVMGNVFAITKGFLEEFGPNRVIDTPISESGFTGMAVGAAMRGLRPVVEWMYDDFITVCLDPVMNQAAKLRYMTGGQVTVPIVFRAPIGAGRRNAGQHSQCLEALFTHIPGLKVVCPSTAADAKGLLKSAIRDDDPVVFLEHKLLYAKKEEIPDEEYLIPLGKAEVKRRRGLSGEGQGKAEQRSRKAEYGAAGEPVDEPCAGRKRNHASYTKAQQDEPYLRFIRPGLHGEGGHAGGEHAVDQPRPYEEVGACRTGFGEGRKFHEASPKMQKYFCPDFYLGRMNSQGKSLISLTY